MNVNTWGPVNTWNVVQEEVTSATGGYVRDPYALADRLRRPKKDKQPEAKIRRIRKTGVIAAESVDQLDLIDVEIERRKALDVLAVLEKQGAEYDALIAIYLSLQALEYRRQLLEEADIVFIIAMLAV